MHTNKALAVPQTHEREARVREHGLGVACWQLRGTIFDFDYEHRLKLLFSMSTVTKEPKIQPELTWDKSPGPPWCHHVFDNLIHFNSHHQTSLKNKQKQPNYKMAIFSVAEAEEIMQKVSCIPYSQLFHADSLTSCSLQEILTMEESAPNITPDD